MKFAASGFIHLAPAATGVFPSDTIVVIFGQVPGATSAPVWQSDRNPVVGDRGKGDHIAALCRWSGLALPGDALTLTPGRLAFAVLIG